MATVEKKSRFRRWLWPGLYLAAMLPAFTDFRLWTMIQPQRDTTRRITPPTPTANQIAMAEKQVRQAWDRLDDVIERLGPKVRVLKNPTDRRFDTKRVETLQLQSVNESYDFDGYVIRELGLPATEAEIRNIELELGFPFPPDLRAALKIHNGFRIEFFQVEGRGFGQMKQFGYNSLEAIYVESCWRRRSAEISDEVHLNLEDGKAIHHQWKGRHSTRPVTMADYVNQLATELEKHAEENAEENAKENTKKDGSRPQ